MPWWQTWIFIVPGLLICLPVGLLGLWKRPTSTTAVKSLVTALTLGLLVATQFVPDDQPTAPTSSRPPAAPSSEPASASAESLAPIEAQVPTARGLSLKQAKKALRGAGLTVGKIEKRPSAKAPGTVLAQSAESGASLALGTSVALVIASPFPLVPWVIGATRAAALRTLQAAGFRVATTTETRSAGPTGVVLSQEPGGRDRLRPNSVVHVVISKVVHTLAGGGGSNCTPGYDPCLVPASDYDCVGGSGNGPAYAEGPIRVTGSDPYDLDSEGDGIACEA